MTQPVLQLNMNKNLASVKNITIRDTGNKEVLEAYFLDQNGQPYNLENKTVTFMENKDGDKFVSDPNVQIVDATGGFIRYTLQSQVHSAPGIAWFEINDNSGLVDSTGNFNIRVENGLRATADNTTYIGAFEKLKQQLEALIAQADGDFKAELQKVDQQLAQTIQDFSNKYNSLSSDFQNQFKDAQNARQQDYTNQKNAINGDWANNKSQIWDQWNGDKTSIDKQAQDTIQAIKDNAQQVVDKDQADWNATQSAWNDTFSRIVKEWQAKTSNLDSTVQDLTTKFGNIINEINDLMNSKLPDMNAKTDAVQAKVDQLRASLGQIDWTSFVKSVNGHTPDGNGAVNLPTLTAKTLIDYDFENGNCTFDDNAHFDANGNFSRWMLGPNVVFKLVGAHKDVRNHTDYRYPTDTAFNTAVNLNSDHYLETGIYKINNCPVANGPWSDTNALHWFYLNVAKYDDYNIVQTMNLGYTLYSRIVSKVGNSYPSWVQYASMDQLYSAVNLRVQSVNGHTPDGNGAVNLPTLTAKTLIDYDFENGNCTFDDNAHFDANGNFSRWMLDPNVVFKLVGAHKDVRNHTDYRYPTDITSNTAVNLNSDPYLDTGIYRIENCAIINSPWPIDPNQRFGIYLKVIKYDDNTIYQSLFFGNQMYGRSISKTNNSFPAWTQYATTDQVTDVSDRLSAVANNLGMLQHRVDYATPSGTISNQTVDFNNYLETGILRVENCMIQNGPYKIGVNVGKDYPHSVFLKVVAFDSQTQYQTVYEGDNLYGRKLFNGSGQWHKYTNTPM